jgi:hypothetical protein
MDQLCDVACGRNLVADFRQGRVTLEAVERRWRSGDTLSLDELRALSDLYNRREQALEG